MTLYLISLGLILFWFLLIFLSNSIFGTKVSAAARLANEKLQKVLDFKH